MTSRTYTVEELADVLRESSRATRDRLYRDEIEWINIGSDRRPRMRVTQEALDAYLKSKRRPTPAAT